MKKTTMALMAMVFVMVTISGTCFADVWQIYQKDSKTIAFGVDFNGTEAVESAAKSVQALFSPSGYKQVKMFDTTVDAGFDEVKSYLRLLKTGYTIIGVTDAQSYSPTAKSDTSAVIYYPWGATTIIDDGISIVQSLL